MVTNKKSFPLRMQESNFEKIRVIAERSKRSIAMQIEFVLERYIEDYEKENGPIEIPDEKE